MRFSAFPTAFPPASQEHGDAARIELLYQLAYALVSAVGEEAFYKHLQLELLADRLCINTVSMVQYRRV